MSCPLSKLSSKWTSGTLRPIQSIDSREQYRRPVRFFEPPWWPYSWCLSSVTYQEWTGTYRCRTSLPYSHCNAWKAGELEWSDGRTHLGGLWILPPWELRWGKERKYDSIGHALNGEEHPDIFLEGPTSRACRGSGPDKAKRERSWGRNSHGKGKRCTF